MSAVDQTITVAPVLPATPVVVCDAPFLHTLAVIEREVAGLKLSTPQDAQNASNYLQRLTTAGTKLEAARKLVKQPFLNKCAEIDNAAKAPAARIEAAKQLIKSKVTAFDEEQRRLAREAEEGRKKELARLEAIKAEEDRKTRERQDELARIATEAAASRSGAFEVPEFDDGEVAVDPKTETEKAIEAVKFAPAVEAPKPAGIAWRHTLLIDSIDVKALPEMFVIRTANEKAIRATFCQGFKEGDPLPECAGVKFRVFKEPVSTGRAQF